MKRKLLINLTGILVAFLIGAILMIVQGYNPIETYGALFNYSLGDWFDITTSMRNSVPLILTGLSASIAFASGPVNLGQPGQLVMGAMLATVAGLYLDLPPALMIPLLLLCGMLGGALWSGLAALMKKFFDMNEFITTLMLNFVADYFTYWLIVFPLFDKGNNNPQTPPIATSGWMPKIGEFHTSVLVMLAAFFVVWFIFNRSRAGYEWRISGQNSLFARLGGVKVDKNYMRVMLLTGALAGLAGALVVMAGPHRFIKGIGANYAWDGVMIAMVANSNLPATLFYGFFFGILQTGSLGMELITAVPSEIITVLQAIIVLVVVAGRGYFDEWLSKQAAKRQARERAA